MQIPGISPKPTRYNDLAVGREPDLSPPGSRLTPGLRPSQSLYSSRWQRLDARRRDHGRRPQVTLH